MVLIHGNADQEALLARLRAACEADSANWECSIQGQGQAMLVIIVDVADRDSKAEIWSYAGRPDAIVEAFEKWLITQRA